MLCSLGRAIALGSLCAASALAAAQTPCNGAALRGRVVDPSAAIIPGAVVTLDGRARQTSGSDGSFTFPCVAAGAHRVHAEAQSFAPLDSNIIAPRELKLTLKPADVETTVRVDASSDSLIDVSPTSSGPAETLAGDQLQALADDPDDLLRELQQMASAAGGSPGGASIGIDGFAGNGDGGSSLPPKSSIAFIKVNPDLFSAEYRNVPFGGGEIQIYTKPGQSAFHGALFATNSSSWMNARDPFSVSTASVGKQRYGAELSGPILKQGSDFTLTLEHRAINNVATTDALVPDANGNPIAFTATVPAPQALWIGLARSDWQLGAKNLFTASFNANHNTFENLGVGGIVLPEGGFSEDRYEYILHLSDITTISPRLMHELRVGVMWDGRTDAPNLTTPQAQVAGYFTGGGNPLQTKRLNEKYNTWDEDVVWTTSKHLLKFGIQTEFLNQHKRLPTNFNGTYIFSGTGTQNALQQYVAAKAGAAAPTYYSDTEGNPEMDFVQVRIAAFIQDDWKLLPNLHLAAGLRYYGQNDLTFVHNYTPRLGLTWTPDKKATWNIHAHAGMFTGRFQSQIYATFITEDGVERVTSTVNNPAAYCPALMPSQFSTTCDPFSSATTIHSIYTAQPGLPNTFFSIEDLGVSHSFPHGWTLTASYDQSQIWHYTRAENINAPLNGSPTGPRPGPANLNILQVQGTGRGYGNVTFASIEQHSLKRLQIFFGAVRNQIIDDTDDSYFLTPQTTGVNTGEYARRDTNGLWNVFGNITVTLPYKLKLGTVFNATGGQPFNITTGSDNNGDGDFNDRPRYASAGMPLCPASPMVSAVPCAYATPYGVLTNSGSGPTISRNKGVMPWTAYLDMNLQRAFTLTHDAKALHPQTLSFNLRASNVLNHLNVTQEGSVLGSSLFNRPMQPTTAAASRPARAIPSSWS